MVCHQRASWVVEGDKSDGIPVYQWQEWNINLRLLQLESQCKHIVSWFCTDVIRLQVRYALGYIVQIDRSIKLRPPHTREEEHMSLSNTILHNSAARAKHTCQTLFVKLCYCAMGCDLSKRNGVELNGLLAATAPAKATSVPKGVAKDILYFNTR